MQYPDDPRISEAKQKGMDALLSALEITNLKRHGPERIGPCPRCGGDDRFGVNVRKGQFLCRRCDGKGDEIALVMFVMGLDFRAALDWICGPVQEISAEERRARAQRDEQNRIRKKREDADFRKRAIDEARKIWRAGAAAEYSPVRDYLALRGITPALLPTLPRSLRFAPDLPYMVAGQPGEWLCAHRGPAMLAVIQGPGGDGTGVHRTWFDLAAPQGKVCLTHPLTGEVQGRKKSWGSKKGGAIRLIKGTSRTLVMGEGIETTLTAAVAGVWPDAHFWAGIDLGNMAGRRQSGTGLKYAGLPDLDDAEAFEPPRSVQRLIYVMDGDSDPRLTRAQLEAGLRRAMVRIPGLVAQIAPCPDGKDLNDVLLAGVT